MIGGRQPLRGSKPGDRRVRVDRPYAPYFRYTGKGVLTAKPAAVAPTTTLGRVGASLRLIHGRPAEDWSLDRLAREAGLSRSVFADRFTHYVGTSPMNYLGRWRMQVAAGRMQAPGVSIAQAGAEVGYESEAAFSRAFKKYVGLPPGTWRRRHRPAHGADPDAAPRRGTG